MSAAGGSAGILSRSLGVFAAAGDTVADCVSLTLGLIAIRLRDRNPDDPRAQRPIAIVALLNAGLLLAVTVAVVIESITGLVGGSPHVVGLPMLIVSVITMLVTLTGAAVLGRRAASEDLHMRSVLIDALADAAAAAGVAIAGLIVLLTGRLFWLDPVIALAIAALVGYAATQLSSKATAMLRGEEVDFDDD